MINLNKKNKADQKNNDKGQKGLMKYGFMMMLCCLIPVVVIAGLPLFGIKDGILSSFAFLLCPLMHIGMLFMMRKLGSKGSCHGNEKNN